MWLSGTHGFGGQQGCVVIPKYRVSGPSLGGRLLRLGVRFLGRMKDQSVTVILLRLYRIQDILYVIRVGHHNIVPVADMKWELRRLASAAA